APRTGRTRGNANVSIGRLVGTRSLPVFPRCRRGDATAACSRALAGASMPPMNEFVGNTYAESLALLSERFGGREALIFEGRRYAFTDLRDQADRASAR